MTPLFALLRGQPVRWQDLGLTRDEFFAVCDREELRGLLFSCIASSERGDDWPASIREELVGSAREAAAAEMVRRREIAEVLEDLHDSGVRAVMIKGAALAYSVYPDPAARARLDTDVVIDAADQVAVREVFARRGYTAPPYCAELFSQIELKKTDPFGLTHIFDVHWQISTQPVFAGLLTHEEILSRAVPVPALGPHALGPSAPDALLLACVHPVMHHQNAERVLWLYDIHLLASRLSRADFSLFTQRAKQKAVAAVCAHQLRLAQRRLGTPIPEGVVGDLSRVDGVEPSAAYLASDRRWHDEMISSFRGLPRVGDRIRLVREVLFPSPSYMLGAYGMRGKPLASCLLPALYVHRNVRGVLKILRGRK